jgi:peptidoglycan hydrolase-like protein with peptidoglycan-binding domain
VRAPVSPGPLVATTPPASPAVASVEHVTELSLEEITELQQLLDRLGLAPGNMDGILTAETEAAIGAYREMAGLPADGGADKALLEELRSVAELYGS